VGGGGVTEDAEEEHTVAVNDVSPLYSWSS